MAKPLVISAVRQLSHGLVVLTFAARQAAATPTVTIRSPVADQQYTGWIELCVTALPANDIVEVIAAVGSDSAQLSRRQGEPCPPDYGTGGWRGSLSFAAASGRKTLVVTARDLYNDTAVDSVTFWSNSIPRLERWQPDASFMVARPAIDVDVRCYDVEGDCTAGVYGWSENVYSQALVDIGRLYGTFDLALFDHQLAWLGSYAKDSAGVTVPSGVWVFVESNPRLHEVDHGTGRLWDVSDRWMVGVYKEQADPSPANIGAYYVVDRASDQVIWWTNVSTSGRRQYRATPRGAFIASVDGEDVTQFWDGVQSQPAISKLWVGERYAVFARAGSPCVRLDLQTGEEVAVPLQMVFGRVTPDGAVVALTQRAPLDSTAIQVYRDGVVTTLARQPRGLLKTLETDGTRVVYVRSDRIFLVDADGPIWEGQGHDPSSGDDRVVGIQNGWLAFEGYAAGPGSAVYRRSPTGEIELVAPFASPSQLDDIWPDGSVTFRANGYLYRKPVAGDVEFLASESALTKWIDGRLHLMLGRSLFELVTAPLPHARPQVTAAPAAGSIAVAWQLPWTDGLRMLILRRAEADQPMAERARWRGDAAAAAAGFADSTALPGVTYRYAIEMQGNAQVSHSDTVSSRWELPPPAVITRLAISSIAPNPFNPTTTVSCALPTAGHAVVRIFDPRGRLVRTLYEGPAAQGELELHWDGRDGAGRRVASGMYEARLTIGGAEATRVMTLIR